MANQTYLKRINRRKILLKVHESGALSRAAIADELGLDRKSVSNLANELIAEGWLCESGSVSDSGRGRPGTLLELNRNEHFFIGLYLSETSVKGILINLHGETLAWKQQAHSTVNLKQIRSSVHKVYQYLRRQAADKLQAIGMAVPGIIDFHTGTVLRSVNIAQLEGIELRSLLPGELPAELFIEESSRAKALAELYFGAGQGRSSFVSIDLGIGIGAGIIAAKRIQGGVFAGEIGHLQIEPGGRLCACGHYGCLEAYISETVLCQRLGEACGKKFDSLEELNDPNAACLEIFSDAGYSLGKGLAAIVNILCPPLIILHGNLTRFQDFFMPSMEKGLTEASLPACKNRVSVKLSKLGKEAASIGAAAAAMRNYFLE